MNKKIPKEIQDFMRKWPDNRRMSVDIRRQYDSTFEEMDNFMRGKQWESNNNKPWLSKPTNNILHKVKNYKVSMISETELRIKMKPLKSEDMEASEQLSSIIQSYFDHANFNMSMLEAKVTSRSFPIGYFKLKFDGSKLPGTQNNIQKGDFVGKSISPVNVFWDPSATEDEELDYIYQTHTVTLDQLRNTAGYNQEVVEDIIKSNQAVKGLDRDSGDVLNREYSFTRDKKSVIIHEISFRWKPNPNADYRYGEIHTAVLEGNEDESAISNIPLFFKSNLGIKRHFIVPLREYKHPHEFMGMSTAQLVLDKVKEINNLDAVSSNLAKQMQNTTKIIAKESGIDARFLAKYGDAAGLVIVSNTNDLNNAIKIVKPIEVPGSLNTYKDGVKKDIEEVANISSASSGLSSGSLGSSDGVNKLIMQAQAQEIEPITRYQKFLTDIIEMMTDYLFNNVKKVERRIDVHDPHSDVEYEFQDINFETYKKLRFDISVNVVMTEFQKQQQKQEVMQIMSLAAANKMTILKPEMIIKLFDFPDSDVIIAEMHSDKDGNHNNEIIQVAQQAAMIMANEIESADQNTENISIEKMAQIAATEAVKNVRNSGGQQEQPAGATDSQTISSPGSGQQASGLAAPQQKP